VKIIIGSKLQAYTAFTLGLLEGLFRLYCRET